MICPVVDDGIDWRRALAALRTCNACARNDLLSTAPKISIVDDDESVRVATVKLVRVHGFVAYGFASAEEFLQSSRASDTSCLITDVRMPGMSGVDLQSHLIAEGKCVPVIFITAFPEQSSQTRAMAAGGLFPDQAVRWPDPDQLPIRGTEQDH